LLRRGLLGLGRLLGLVLRRGLAAGGALGGQLALVDDGHVVADGTAGHGAEYRVMVRVVAGDAADDGAADAAGGFGASREGGGEGQGGQQSFHAVGLPVGVSAHSSARLPRGRLNSQGKKFLLLFAKRSLVLF
jgi:hypothetical protein